MYEKAENHQAEEGRNATTLRVAAQQNPTLPSLTTYLPTYLPTYQQVPTYMISYPLKRDSLQHPSSGNTLCTRKYSRTCLRTGPLIPFFSFLLTPLQYGAKWSDIISMGLAIALSPFPSPSAKISRLQFQPSNPAPATSCQWRTYQTT